MGALEDRNANGRLDAILDAIGYCGRSGSETDAQDMDTDDDGIRDLDELNGVLSGARATSPFCFDTDGDGLSDGLEIGLKSTQATPVRTPCERSTCTAARSAPSSPVSRGSS